MTDGCSERLFPGTPVTSVSYTFDVPGIPAPQGDMKGFVVAGKARLTTKNPRLRSWRNDIAAKAQDTGMTPMLGPVKIGISFYFPRPASHYGTGRNAGRLKQSALVHWQHDQRPDIDKLCRGVLDALTGIAYRDDSQVTSLGARKIWNSAGGTQITVEAL